MNGSASNVTQKLGWRRMEGSWNASTCHTMDELRGKMRQLYGKVLEYKVAVSFVRESEANGQDVLFDPRDLFKRES